MVQTYLNWEMIIIDDCSIDSTQQVVEKYIRQDSRGKYYKLQANFGVAKARTMGMKLAVGDIWRFLIVMIYGSRRN